MNLFLVLFFVHHCSSASLGEEEVEIVNTDAKVSERVVEERKITGSDCEYIMLCDVIKNAECQDGNKFVIRKKRGTRKQFLILNGSPALGFVRRKKKFTNCKSYTQITSNLKCKAVSGLSSLDLLASSNNSSSSNSSIISSNSSSSNSSIVSSNSSSSTNSSFFRAIFENSLEELEDIKIVESMPNDEDKSVERVIRGNDCEFIKICDVTSNTGCSDGNKLVLKKKSGLRRQFLILNGSPVLGFVQRKKKFTSCNSYTDITDDVDCKSVSGLSNINLSSSSNSSSSSSNNSSSSNSTSALLL